MTWKELAQKILSLAATLQEDDVTIHLHLDDKYLPAELVLASEFATDIKPNSLILEVDY